MKIRRHELLTITDIDMKILQTSCLMRSLIFPPEKATGKKSKNLKKINHFS